MCSNNLVFKDCGWLWFRLGAWEFIKGFYIKIFQSEGEGFKTHHCKDHCKIKTGKQEVNSSIPGRPNCLEFFVVFSETQVNMG